MAPKLLSIQFSADTYGRVKKQSGMTFIEVLVALVILTTGILGAVAMQATAKKGSFDAMQRSVASAVAQDIIERIRSNSADSVALANYVGTYGADALAVPPIRCQTPASLCTSAEMATNDLYEWSELLRGADAKTNANNTGGLMGARGCIQRNNQTITVVISWQGRTATVDGGDIDCGDSSAQRRQLSLSAFIF